MQTGCAVCETRKAKLISQEDGESVLICSQLCSNSFWIAERLRPHQERINGLYEDGFRVIAAPICEKKPGGSDRASEGACGEDSFFISTESLLFGVADGVGGYGGQAGFFARCLTQELLRLSNNIIESRRKSGVLDGAIAENFGTEVALKSLIDRARNKCRLEGLPEGGSTAVIALVEPKTKRITIANIGDSAAMVLRGNKILIRTLEQMHSGGAPYQLTNTQRGGDTGSEAHVYHYGPLRKGDVIIMGSDGLWDNLNDEEVVSLVTSNRVSGHFKRAYDDLTKVGEVLLKEAIKADRKPDDITIVTARVYNLDL